MIRLKLTQKNLLIGAMVCILMVVIFAAAVMKLSGKQDPVVLVPVDEVETVAQEYAESEDVDGGLAYYDEQIEERQNEDEKKQLLVYKAGFAQKAGRLDVAIDAAKKADQISPDIMTAQTLAEANEAAGNSEEAIKYYEKMIEIVKTSGDEMASSYVILWEAKIQELEQ